MIGVYGLLYSNYKNSVELGGYGQSEDPSSINSNLWASGPFSISSTNSVPVTKRGKRNDDFRPWTKIPTASKGHKNDY